MRSYPDDDDDREELKRLNAESWMVEHLKLNPDYTCWGPGEDYMSTKGESWSSNQDVDSWQAFGPWGLDDLNECVNFYFEITRDSEKAAQAAGERRRVFVNSISDFMEIHRDATVNAELEHLRVDFWDLVLSCSWLDFLILTKRIENAERVLAWGDYGAFAAPFRNVWIGVTAEDDEHARKRIPVLRSVDAAVRFVSYEPALGRIDWTPHLVGDGRPDLVIFGDESGRKRRPAELDWARETRDACAAAGVTFHFKQWCGADVDGLRGERDGKRTIHLPVLDGRRHAEMPEVRHE